MTKPVSFAIALFLARTVIAQTFIMPGGDCGAVTLQVTRGAEFPDLGERIRSEEVATAYLFLPKQRIAVEAAPDRRSFDFNATIPRNGVVMASIDFKPTITGNETRTEHAKAFIRCGAIDRFDDWQRSTGLGLEIIPQWNGLMPLKAGDSMRFIAIEKATGKLLRDIPMELYRAGAGHIATGVRDKSGGVNFPFNGPDRYMVVATYRRPDPQQSGLWLVDTSTLTFDIR